MILYEVKTAFQGSSIADRQNANNMVPVLIRNYLLQKSLGREQKLERNIRFLAMAHDTNSMWIRGWFYILWEDGRSKWSSTLIKQVPFAMRTENEYQIAPKYCLNWMDNAYL